MTTQGERWSTHYHDCEKSFKISGLNSCNLHFTRYNLYPTTIL